MTTAASPPVEASRRVRRVALMGNPNTGKSTIFNHLTGIRQRVANYPGITTEAKHGTMSLPGGSAELLDLPGAYSLTASSPDERVVIDVLLGHEGFVRPDLLVCILDASNLQRNLFLASQLAEFEIPMILVLNHWDVAKKQGLRISREKLEEHLGVPVLATVGAKGEGIAELRAAIAETLESPRKMTRISWRDGVNEAAAAVVSGGSECGVELTRPEAMRLLFDFNSALKERFPAERRKELEAILDRARDTVHAAGLNPAAAEAVLHYGHLERILEESVEGEVSVAAGQASESIDRLLLHRVWGSLIFLGIMWLVFQSVYAWAGPLMDGIDSLTGIVQDAVSPLLSGLPIFQSLVVDGIIAGVGGVVIFVPQIVILFLFIALLEGSGYMARAAFLMDKMFGWCGLNGKSFVPLLSSYACAIPGVMAARSLEDGKARITTIMLAPFMSCSARLPVYLLMIGAFIEPQYGAFVAGGVLFAMHFVGLAVSVPIAWFVNRVVTRTPSLPFILEMPRYQVPVLRNLLLKMWEGGREFIVRAGTIILAFSVIIWALLYFPRSASVEQAATETFMQEVIAAGGIAEQELATRLADEESELATELRNRVEGAYVEQSYLGRFGKAVQPVFDPAGFDWKVTVGVISSFPAREVIIATLGITYKLGGDVDEESDSLRDRMKAETWTSGARAGQPVFTIPVVVAIMVFFALCSQCGATVAVIARQLNWGWAILSFGGMTLLAWVAAVVVYQLGTFLSSISSP